MLDSLLPSIFFDNGANMEGFPMILLPTFVIFSYGVGTENSGIELRLVMS